jgi:hypothetical protein
MEDVHKIPSKFRQKSFRHRQSLKTTCTQFMVGPRNYRTALPIAAAVQTCGRSGHAPLLGIINRMCIEATRGNLILPDLYRTVNQHAVPYCKRIFTLGAVESKWRSKRTSDVQYLN